MKYLSLFFLLLIVISANDPGKISGIITDKQSGQPIEKVNVYLARTMLGAATNENGKFVLTNLPAGKYTLVISHLSYENQEIEINIYPRTQTAFSFKLKPKPIEFPEIDVTDEYDDEWWNNLETFKEGLLGTTWLADSCKILNPFVINFQKDDEGKLLASANTPIKILNKSLGYKITYFLKYFIKDFYTTKFSGLPYFEEIKPEIQTDSLRWGRNRLQAYMGSLRHFLRTLSESYKNKEPFNITENKELFNMVTSAYTYSNGSILRDNGFTVYQPLNQQYSINRKTLHFPMDPQQVIVESSDSNSLILKTDKSILVIYEKEYQPLERIPQDSYLITHADSVYFDTKGRYYDEFLLEKFGYMAKQRLAEMLPFEYEPSDSVLINTDFR